MPELTPNYKFKKPIPDKEVADITVINENFDTADNEIKKSNDSIKNLENNKQNKEDSTLKTIVKTIVGAINELYDELIKKATKTQIGRIKVGNNLTVDEDGTLHGNPEYTHPTGNGNNHIPANGGSGNFLKWLSSGAAQWVNITWNDITEKPNSFTPSDHTHTKANITDFPTSMKNPNALEIKMNGQNPVSYDGAAAKSINITPGSIGSYTKQEVDTKVNEKANTNHTHPYLPTSGGTISGSLTVTGTGVFNGHLTSQNEVTAFSDRKLKTELKVIRNSIEKIKKINGYTYKMLGVEKRQAGVIAQEIREVLPEVVIENENGLLSVAYGNISALLIEAIKEIDERLTKIESQLSGGIK